MEGSSSPQEQFPEASCSQVCGAPWGLQAQTEATVAYIKGQLREMVSGAHSGVKHSSAAFQWGSEVSLSKMVVTLPWGLPQGLCLSLVRS